LIAALSVAGIKLSLASNTKECMSMSDNVIEGFTDVDHTNDPLRYVHHLGQLQAMEAVQRYKRQTFALLDIKKGDRLLDVGCGTGDDVRAMARFVGPTGRVIGIDVSEAMVSEATSHAAGEELPIEYRLGDAQNLEWPDGIFDGCRADRTLQHLQNPRAAINEMIRVARSGARIVVSEPDWGTFVIDAEDRIVTSRILNLISDSVRNGWIGRQLPRLLSESGLTAVAVVPVTFVESDYGIANEVFSIEAMTDKACQLGLISSEEASTWLGHLADSNRAGYFFSSLTGFVVYGLKP
jgi:ubiquinone/menaquinone biosynthesis C-methylase UbiE